MFWILGKASGRGRAKVELLKIRIICRFYCEAQSQLCASLPSPPQDSQSSVGSPLSRVGTQIIGAEDDDFDTEQEQVGAAFYSPPTNQNSLPFFLNYLISVSTSCMVK